MFDFQEATRDNILIKMALDGPPGSGKTWTSLCVAVALATSLNLGDVYLIDSENESSKKYVFNPKTGKGWKFKALYMPKNDYSPQTYMKAIRRAEQLGARIIVIDSLTHAWCGVNGILDQVDQLTEQAGANRGSKYGNSFTDGWKKATPIQNEFVQAILASPAHIIATMRADPEWVIPDGKKNPEMVGMSPKQRKDISFEFDIAMSMNRDNQGVVWKTRCEALKEHRNGVFPRPGADFAAILTDWVSSCDDVATTNKQETAQPVQAPVNQRHTKDLIDGKIALFIERYRVADSDDEVKQITAQAGKEIPQDRRGPLRAEIAAANERLAKSKSAPELAIEPDLPAIPTDSVLSPPLAAMQHSAVVSADSDVESA